MRYCRRYGRKPLRGIVTALAVPLAGSQVTAASALHDQLLGWATTDRALIALGERFAAFDPEATLLKVAAVNQLYGANVYAVARMAEHIVTVLDGTDIAAGGTMLSDVALVERLAALPKTPARQSARKHVSFASKFAHFFIDRERFPNLRLVRPAAGVVPPGATGAASRPRASLPGLRGESAPAAQARRAHLLRRCPGPLFLPGGPIMRLATQPQRPDQR